MAHSPAPTVLYQQATALGKYLIGEVPCDQAVELYAQAMRKVNVTTLSARDRKLLKLVTHHPWLIGPVDGGLVFIDPHSEVRRRLYVLFAILESLPAYSDKFLPRQRSPLYLVVIGLVGVRAVLRALLGVIIIKVRT